MVAEYLEVFSNYTYRTEHVKILKRHSHSFDSFSAGLFVFYITLNYELTMG